jgi:hypothetical protein
MSFVASRHIKLLTEIATSHVSLQKDKSLLRSERRYTRGLL